MNGNFFLAIIFIASGAFCLVRAYSNATNNDFVSAISMTVICSAFMALGGSSVAAGLYQLNCSGSTTDALEIGDTKIEFSDPVCVTKVTK